MRRPYVGMLTRDFYLDKIDFTQIHVDDIACALSKQCRFAGNLHRFYSVAQHSTLVSYFVPRELALWGLMHDASEAYIGDLIRPVKYLEGMNAYRALENSIMVAVAIKFELLWPMPAAVKEVDDRLLWTEDRDLRKRRWFDRPCFDFTIRPVTPAQAEYEFYRRYTELTSAQKDKGK